MWRWGLTATPKPKDTATEHGRKGQTDPRRQTHAAKLAEMPGPGESPLGSSTLLPPITSPALGCCEITWYLSKNHTLFYPLAALERFLYFGEVSLTLSLDPLIGVEFSSESCPWPFGGAWLGPSTAQSPLCPGSRPHTPCCWLLHSGRWLWR